MTVENINEDGIQELFFDYLNADYTIQETFDLILVGCLNEGFDDLESQFVVEAVILPSIISVFAECLSDGDVQAVFDSFCVAEGISGELQDAVATAINEAAESDATEMSLDWKKMSADERIAAVKAFLKKLKNTVPRPDKPFFNTNPVVSAAARTRPPVANEETVKEHEEHTKHPLHDVCEKFGYIPSHVHPIVQPDRSTRDYHSFTNRHAHQVGAYSGSDAWTSRTVASGHSFSGKGAAQLESHLKNKQRRQKYEEEKSLPNIPLLEGLMNTDWPAPGSEDTELGVFMEPEVSHGKTKVYTRVQA